MKNNYLLPNGREVFLVRYGMVGTYSGFVEGSRQRASEYIREHLFARARNVLDPALPLAPVCIPTGELPWWFYVAELESYGGVRHTNSDYNSFLYTCWFTDDTTQNIHQMIEGILPHIDWERIAEDYDSMNI